jgi:hypothetical protein
MGRAAKQAKRDMEKMQNEYGADYVGYHSSIAKGERTTSAQRTAYAVRQQSQGKSGKARRK